MPDRSLTYSRWEEFGMPSQPVWFQRLDEILTLLRDLDAGYLDPTDGREAVERCVRSSGKCR